MKKQITLVLVALFICNLCVFAQELPQIASIELVGRGLGNASFGHYKDFCAQESEGVFTWVGRLYYNGTGNESTNQSFKCYAYDMPGTDQMNENYALFALTADEGPEGLKYATVEDGGTYPVTYAAKGSDPYTTDNKWRLKYGEDGVYKLTFDVQDPYVATMSVQKMDETYANLGSLLVEGYSFFAVRDGGEETEGFDPDIYEYNCYIPANDTYSGVTYFAYRNTQVAFNGSATGNSYTNLITVSDGDISTITVTGFDNATTKTYTINYKNDATGINRNDASKVIYSVAGQILTVAGVDAYAVYSVSGTVAADVRSNAPGKTVSLSPGVYVVKTNTAETFKIVIK